MRYEHLVIWLIVITGAAGSLPSASAQTSRSSDLPPQVAPAATPLRPGDVLRLKIWREEDLSGDFQIDESGKAILPRLGPTKVADIPADQLRDQLVRQYAEYLNNPSIEVIPLRRIAILGSVRNPGFHRIDPSVTLGEVTNIAGGAMPQSRQNQLELRRGAQRWRVDFNQRPELASTPLTSGDQVFVPERSWLRQNATWFVSTLVGVAGTAAYLIVR
jgi:polysaccharide export outer membrane protein